MRGSLKELVTSCVRYFVRSILTGGFIPRGRGLISYASQAERKGVMNHIYILQCLENGHKINTLKNAAAGKFTDDEEILKTSLGPNMTLVRLPGERCPVCLIEFSERRPYLEEQLRECKDGADQSRCALGPLCATSCRARRDLHDFLRSEQQEPQLEKAS